VKKAKMIMEIMEILAAYDLTQGYRDAAGLVGCAPNMVARYVRARGAGEQSTKPRQRTHLRGRGTVQAGPGVRGRRPCHRTDDRRQAHRFPSGAWGPPRRERVHSQGDVSKSRIRLLWTE
jgi:hypothetical protein